MQNNQRKLVNIFKQFLERAIVPQIKNNPSLSASCQYFTTILTQQPVDVNGLQAIIDTFPTNRITQPYQNSKVPPAFVKKKDDIPNTYDYSQQSSNGFNPSRTFGGERNRYTMFQPKKQEISHEAPVTSMDYKGPLLTQNSRSLGNMENIYRTFLENQQKLEQLSQQQPTSTYTTRGSSGGQERTHY